MNKDVTNFGTNTNNNMNNVEMVDYSNMPLPNKGKKTNHSGKKKFIIILIIIIIIGIVCFIYSKSLNKEVNTNNKEKEQKNEETEVKDLDTTSDEVLNLHELIPNIYIVNDNNTTNAEGYNAYSSSGTTNYLNTIDGVLESAIYMAKKNTSVNKNSATCNELISNNILKESECDSTHQLPYYKIDINKDKISTQVKKIIGIDNEKTFKYQSIEDTTLVCSYKNNKYYCYDIEGGDTGIESISKITRATKTNSEITIYDKYIAFVNGKYYSSFDMLEHLATGDYVSSITVYENSYSTAPTYKHIFKKDSEGNYYWYSTEPYKDGVVDDSVKVEEENNTSTNESNNTSATTQYEKLDNNDDTTQELFKIFTNYSLMEKFISNQNTVYLSDLSKEDYEAVAFSSSKLKGTKVACSKYNLDYSKQRTLDKNGDCCYMSDLEYSNYTTEYTLVEVKEAIKYYLGEDIANNYNGPDLPYNSNTISTSYREIIYDTNNQKYYCDSYWSGYAWIYTEKLDSAYKDGNNLIINALIINDTNESEKYNYKFTFTYNNSTNSYNFTKLEKTKLN